MILIIAEKPSLARNIVSAIGNMKKIENYYEGEKHIVTWAFGHLFSLADIEYYNPNSDSNGKWNIHNIPCFPKEFVFELKKDKTKKVDYSVKKQFNTIKTLCQRSDVDTIVNAGDSDREGEIIIRICINKALATGKIMKRLWMPDQTAETIIEGLSQLKDEKIYDGLANEGYARTYIDWLYGVNLTRYATLKTGTFLRVGRVIVPIVKAVYDRDMSIINFVPDIYYAIVSKTETNGEVIELLSKNKFDKDKLSDAQKLCELYNETGAIVKNIKRKNEILSPGKLYSLTKLQNFLGKKYKMSMEDSLRITQALYEKGYLTYPRTNSEYLASAEQEKIKKIIASISTLGYPIKFKFANSIFDDKKIESHSALTPTYKIPNKGVLSEEEYIVYSAVLRRFVAVFCAVDCDTQKTEITIDVGKHESFSLKGTVIINPGWTKYDDYTKKDKTLPKLEKGDKINIEFKPSEKQTTPPKRFTIETLNNYLKNPFREDKANIENNSDEDDYKAIFEGLELGTEATRTGIINNAIKSEYIQLKKDVYSILPAGEHLVNSLMRMNISMDKYKTSELGKALKSVYRGEMTVAESVLLAEKEIKSVFEKKESSPQTDTDDGFYMDVIGKCPSCGNEIIRTKFGYGCRGYKEGCKFTVNNVICERVISVSNIKRLLETGKTYKIEGFVSKKSGKTFSANLKYENGKVIFDFT